MRMPVTVHRLSNGTAVWISPNDQEARFAARVVVRAGSAMDPRDQTGVAHQLEHVVMNKGGATLRRGELKAVYGRLGAKSLNAYTGTDRTSYLVDLPAGRLGAWAAIEADRLRGIVLDDGFDSEMEVIREEKRRALDDPGRALREAHARALFAGHPYGVPILGEPEHLARPSREALGEFHRRWYRPSEVALVIAGDVDVDAAVAILEEAFGGIGEPPRERDREREPERVTRERSRDAEGGASAGWAPGRRPQRDRERVTVVHRGPPALRLGWRTVDATHPDRDALRLVTLALSNGLWGLLDRNLVQAQRVRGAQANGWSGRFGGMFTVDVAPREGQSPADAEAAARGEVRRLLDGDGLDASELRATLRNLEVGELRGLEDNASRASRMMSAFVTGRSWAEVEGTLDRMRALTVDDVVAAARRYLGDEPTVAWRTSGEPTLPSMDVPPVAPDDLPPRTSPLATRVSASSPAAAAAPQVLRRGADYTIRGRGVGPDASPAAPAESPAAPAESPPAPAESADVSSAKPGQNGRWGASADVSSRFRRQNRRWAPGTVVIRNANPFSDLSAVGIRWLTGTEAARGEGSVFGLWSRAGVAGGMTRTDVAGATWAHAAAVKASVGRYHTDLAIRAPAETLAQVVSLAATRLEAPDMPREERVAHVDDVIERRAQTRGTRAFAARALKAYARRGEDSAMLTRRLTDDELRALVDIDLGARTAPYLARPATVVATVPEGFDLERALAPLALAAAAGVGRPSAGVRAAGRSSPGRGAGVAGAGAAAGSGVGVDAFGVGPAAPALHPPIRYARRDRPAVLLLHHPAAQATVGFHLPAGPWRREGLAARQVWAEYVSGGSGALFREIRERRGLAYSAKGGLASGWRAGDEDLVWGEVACDPDKVPEVARLLRELLPSPPMDDDAIARARAAAVTKADAGRVKFRNVGWTIERWRLRGLLDEGDPRVALRSEVRAVDVAAVRAWCDPLRATPATISVVGDLRRIDRAALDACGEIREVALDELVAPGADLSRKP